MRRYPAGRIPPQTKSRARRHLYLHGPIHVSSAAQPQDARLHRPLSANLARRVNCSLIVPFSVNDQFATPEPLTECGPDAPTARAVPFRGVDHDGLVAIESIQMRKSIVID